MFRRSAADVSITVHYLPPLRGFLHRILPAGEGGSALDRYNGWRWSYFTKVHIDGTNVQLHSFLTLCILASLVVEKT